MLRPIAVRWAASYVDTQDAEDVAQSAMALLVQKASEVELTAVEGWLRTTIWKAASSHRRCRREVLVNELPERAAQAPGPEDTLVSAQLGARVRDAMDAIVSSRRRILEGVALDGRTLADVAREEGIPESAARVRRAAAEQELQERLHRQRVEERRRTGGSSSWAFLPWWGIDLRSSWRRVLPVLVGVTAIPAALLFPSEQLRPTIVELPARVVETETVRPVTPLPEAERSASGSGRSSTPATAARPRDRHDGGARFRAERFGAP